MLTPAELKKKELLEKKKHLYNKEETDALLQDIYANYEELYTKYEEMTRSAKKLSDGVQYYKSIETTLQKALVLAEKTAKETKDAAEAKAATIEAQANEKARQIVADAEKENEQLKVKCNHLVDLFKQYKSQFIQVTSNNLQLLNSKEFDINIPELDQMYNEQKPETESGIKKQLESTQDLVAAISSNLSNPNIEPGIKKIAETEMNIQAPEPIVEQKNDAAVEEEVQPPKIQYNQDADVTKEVAATEELEVAEAPKNEPETIETETVEEKPQTLDSLLNDLNMNGKKQDDEDPFEFLGSLDDF